MNNTKREEQKQLDLLLYGSYFEVDGVRVDPLKVLQIHQRVKKNVVSIRAKQLYEIYKGLPNINDWLKEHHASHPYHVALMPKLDINEMMEETTTPPHRVDVPTLQFQIDIDTHPFEWRPVQTLVIH